MEPQVPPQPPPPSISLPPKGFAAPSSIGVPLEIHIEELEETDSLYPRYRRLAKSYSFNLNGVPYRVPAPYVFDGGSIPIVARPLAGGPWRMPDLIAYTVHDACWDGILLREDKMWECPPDFADEMLYWILLAVGRPRLEARLKYFACRSFYMLLGYGEYGSPVWRIR